MRVRCSTRMHGSPSRKDKMPRSTTPSPLRGLTATCAHCAGNTTHRTSRPRHDPCSTAQPRPAGVLRGKTRTSRSDSLTRSPSRVRSVRSATVRGRYPCPGCAARCPVTTDMMFPSTDNDRLAQPRPVRAPLQPLHADSGPALRPLSTSRYTDGGLPPSTRARPAHWETVLNGTRLPSRRGATQTKMPSR